MQDLVACLTPCYGRFGARTAIERVRSAGLSSIELPIRTSTYPSRWGDAPLLTELSTEADVAVVRELVARHDIAISAVNVISGNPLRPEVVDVTLRKLELAASLGVRIVIGEAGGAETPDELARLDAHLRRIGDRCVELGLTYCCETHPGECQDANGMLGLMERLAHPAIALNFDTANILYYNAQVSGEIALAKVCRFVRHVHLKDSQGEFGKWYFPALGYGGAVDFFRVRQILSTAGFHGPYSIEIGGIADEGPLTLEQHHQRVVDSVRHLRDCGYFDG